jgi:hypothetical protein
MEKADLEAIAEGDRHAEWVLDNHRPRLWQEGRQRCTSCDAWWPCDTVGLAALAVLRRRERDEALA